jgi:predicted ferric reductase
VIAAVATTHSRALWYLTRGSGLVALVLLTASVVLGILEVKRWATERWPRFMTAALHKNVSLLAVVFLGVHIATTVVDGFAPIGWADAVVPFRSPYRPLWLGLGALAVDLLLAVVVTSLLRARIGYRAWKAVHWAAYACWPVAVLHGMGTGTDTKLGLVLLLYFACLAAVVLAVWWRLADALAQQRSVHRGAVAAAIASVAVPVGLLAFLFAGPLKPGWSRRAGTPASLTTAAASSPAPAPSPSSGSAAAAAPAASSFTGRFSDALAGTIAQSSDGTTVTIDGALTGPAPGHLHIVLSGQPANGGGIVMTASGASLGPAGQPNLYQGSVRSLSGTRLGLALAGPGGSALAVRVQLALNGGTAVTGTVSGGPGAAGGSGDD